MISWIDRLIWFYVWVNIDRFHWIIYFRLYWHYWWHYAISLVSVLLAHHKTLENNGENTSDYGDVLISDDLKKRKSCELTQQLILVLSWFNNSVKQLFARENANVFLWSLEVRFWLPKIKIISALMTSW